LKIFVFFAIVGSATFDVSYTQIKFDLASFSCFKH